MKSLQLIKLIKSSLVHAIIIAAVAVAGLGAAGASASESCPSSVASAASLTTSRIDIAKAQELLGEARMNRSEAASLRQMAAGEKLFGNWLDATRNEQRAERLEANAVMLQNEACDLGLCTFRPLVRPPYVYRPVVYVRPASSVVIVHDRNHSHGRHDGIVVHR